MMVLRVSKDRKENRELKGRKDRLESLEYTVRRVTMDVQDTMPNIVPVLIAVVKMLVLAEVALVDTAVELKKGTIF